MSTGTNPYRNPGEIILAAKTSSSMEIPQASEKKDFISAVKAGLICSNIDPVMREKRLTTVREFILRRLNKITTETIMNDTTDYYYNIPTVFLRCEITRHSLNQECVYLNTKLREEFAAKGWKLYISLSESVIQPWDWKFWRQERVVILFTSLDLEPA
jgi:hypothetical protein